MSANAPHHDRTLTDARTDALTDHGVPALIPGWSRPSMTRWPFTRPAYSRSNHS